MIGKRSRQIIDEKWKKEVLSKKRGAFFIAVENERAKR